VATDVTHLTAQLTIAANAAMGLRNLTVTSSAEVVTLLNGFTVTGGSLTISLSPNATIRGQSLGITVTAQNTHFQQGITRANFGPGVSVGGGIGGGFGLVQVTSPTTALAQVSVPANAATGLRTVVVQTDAEQTSSFNAFAVTGAAFLSSITPNSARMGQSPVVTINGVFTSFAQGVTQANFGAGISVGGAAEGTFGPVTVTGPTTATAQLAINAAAAPGL